jgi:hypothetical protein
LLLLFSIFLAINIIISLEAKILSFIITQKPFSSEWIKYAETRAKIHRESKSDVKTEMGGL